jgi:N6-adenosine-specific RNA methylase IME4
MGKAIYTKAEREEIERKETQQALAKSHARQKHAAPAEEQRALIKLGDATKMLAEVRDAPGAKKLMDVAAAAELYARKAKLGQEAVNYAAGIKLDAERKLGQYLKATPDAPKGGDTRSNGTRTVPLDSPPTLADLGISKKLSSEAQRLASIDDETYAKVRTGEIKPMVALRDQKRATLGERIAALPAGKFRVIYADPPWKYGDERGGSVQSIGGDGSRADSSAADKYPTMPTDKICEFTDETGRHVSDLAATDAVLFMWATFPLLEDAMRVIPAWGFKYKTAFVWHKQRSNVGNYHDASCELLMICIRGSCPIEVDERVSQLQSIPRGRHSEKLEEFRAIVDKLYPSGPRVELFRRGAAPDGWVVWGNEAVAA